MANMYMPAQYIKDMEALKTYINKLDINNKYNDVDKIKDKIMSALKKLNFELKDMKLSFEFSIGFRSNQTTLDTLLDIVPTYTTMEQLISLKILINNINTDEFDYIASYNLAEDAYNYYGNYKDIYNLHTRTLADLRDLITNTNPLNIFEIECHEGVNITSFARETDNTYGNTDYNGYTLSTARTRMTRVIKGTLKGAFISNNFFDVVMLTPMVTYKYEADAFGKVMPPNEAVEIRNCIKYVRPGGLYMITLPATRVSNSLALFLSKVLSEDTLIIKEPNSSLERVTIIGKKDVSNKAKQSLLDRLTYIDYDSLDTSDCYAPGFTIPQEVLELEYFRGSKLDVDDILSAAQNNLIKNFTENQTQPLVIKDQSPLLPFNIGQVGLVLTSGCLDGVVEEIDGVYHVIKGMTTKLSTTETDDSVENEIKSTETISNQVKINVFTADGKFIQLG